MKKQIINVAILLPLSPVIFANQETDTRVFLENDKIYYTGTLTPEGNESVFKVYNDSKVKPKTLSITSDGGDVELGIALGEWVFDKKLDVEVEDYCLSSCANYIFTSGRYKYISNKAIIGFHGGASSQEFDTSEIDEMFETLPKKKREEEVKKLLQQMQAYLDEVKKDEDALFKKTKVKQEITTLGQSQTYRKFDPDQYTGWTYLPQDYSKLGVRNVIVKNPPWKLVQQQNFGKLFIVNVDTDN
ncbi:peptidase [Vibrio harveyi]|uniref:peptidase n=1 Tax=Vibrio harveyi TaxID=669 RepID=UPI000425BDD4|nr:peptidase [Vibrio harveyi]KNY39812.1 peptidase [Vibrio harveyi]